MANFCKYCGEKLNPGAKFCRGCGHSLAGVSGITEKSVNTPQYNMTPVVAEKPATDIRTSGAELQRKKDKPKS